MSFADKNPIAIAKLMAEISGDGHSVLSAEWINANVDESLHDLLEPMIEEHKSNFNHPKLTIFKEGYPVDSMHGIHALDLHYQIARDLGLESVVGTAATMNGRGTQAAELSKGILSKL